MNTVPDEEIVVVYTDRRDIMIGHKILLTQLKPKALVPHKW